MAQNPLRPKILIDYGRQNEPLRVPISDVLLNPQAETFITTNSISGLGILTVKDITNFRVNQILFVGQEGNQGSEIIKTHASTVPSGSTITLASTTGYPHTASTKVLQIPYNQIEFSYATTATGSKTVLILTNIVAGLRETRYLVSQYTTGLYFARWKENIGNTFSSYSDPVPVAGYTRLMARSIIDSALSEINKTTSDVLTDSFAFQQINNCQTEVLKEMRRWSFMQNFDQIVTNTTVGAIRAPFPSDVDDQNTNTSIWNFRLGTLPNMTWIDKEKYDELTSNISQTTASQLSSVGASTVVLSDSSDFDDSGTFYHRTNSSAISYLSNNRATNTLTIGSNGITGTLKTRIVTGVEVYQNPTFGLPQFWTAFGGFAYHYPLTASAYRNKNYLLDYYKSQTAITLDTDTIVIPDPTLVQYYLQWKFLKKLANGEETSASLASKAEYLNRKNILKQKDNPNRTFRLKPRRNDINESGLDNSTKRERLANFPSDV